MLLIQKLFRENTIEDAQKTLEDLGIAYKEETSPLGDIFVHLDYDMIKGIRTSDIVKECRGIVLNKSNWDIIRYGFRRFMNFGELGQDKIDYEKLTEYEEKLDGSLIFLHYLEGIGWNVGTRGRVFPTDYVNNFNITFPQLFWTIFDKNKINDLNKNICYLFELCSLTNLVVIKHTQPKIVLTGGRYISTWAELSSEELKNEAQRMGFERPTIFFFASIQDILDYTEKMNKNLGRIEHEGIVIKQWDGNGSHLRIKVKSEQYVSLHNILSVRSLNNMVKIVLNNDKNILEGLEEFLLVYDKIDEKIKKLESDSEECFQKAFESINGVLTKESRKIFAQNVCTTPHSAYCFSKLDGKIKDFNDWKEQLKSKSNIKTLIKKLELEKVVGPGWVIVEDETADI